MQRISSSCVVRGVACFPSPPENFDYSPSPAFLTRAASMPPRKRLKPTHPAREPMQTRSRAREWSASAASTSSSPAGSASAAGAAAPLAVAAAASGSRPGSSTGTRRHSTASTSMSDDCGDTGSAHAVEYGSDGPVASNGDDENVRDTDGSDIVMVERAPRQRAADLSSRLAEPVVVLSSDEEPPPEPVRSRGKLTSRKQFAADLASLADKLNSVGSESPVSSTAPARGV